MNEELLKAAVAWWKYKQPIGYTTKDHIKNWQVNTFSKPEERLAKAVARHIKEKGKS